MMMRSASKEIHRLVATAFAVTTILLSSAYPAFASTPSNVFDFPRMEQSQTIQGEEYKLLDTFINNKSAFDSFKNHYHVFLEKAKSDGLPELSETTASLYKSYAQSNGDTSFAAEKNKVLAFLDIYENPVENEKIKQDIVAIKQLSEDGELSSAEADYQISKILPIRNGQSDIIIEPLNSGINLRAAQAYAAKYATSPNPTYGYEKSWGLGDADCTNFASQILHAGGINMVYANNISSGWWWRAKGNRSLSWIQANTFANYMGSGYNTRSWNSFVDNVRSGDFIALDNGNDGSIDHIGFVYNKAAAGLQIAQHSNDYLSWSYNTGWPSAGSDGARYYRIRR